MVNKFKEARMEEDWDVPDREDVYYRDLMYQRFKRLRKCWRDGKVCRLPSGELETEEEWAARIEAVYLKDLHKGRHLERRIKVSFLLGRWRRI
jgi:hypothetical protein